MKQRTREAKLQQLKLDQHKFELILDKLRHESVPQQFNSDPAVRQAAGTLDGILDEIEELSSAKQKTAAVANPTEMILEQYRRELDVDREDHAKLLAQMRESIPEHQEILTLLRDREEKAKQKTRMEDKLDEFGIVREALLNSDCVRIPGQCDRADRAKGQQGDVDRPGAVRELRRWGSAWFACSSTSTTR